MSTIQSNRPSEKHNLTLNIISFTSVPTKGVNNIVILCRQKTIIQFLKATKETKITFCIIMFIHLLIDLCFIIISQTMSNEVLFKTNNDRAMKLSCTKCLKNMN